MIKLVSCRTNDRQTRCLVGARHSSVDQIASATERARRMEEKAWRNIRAGVMWQWQQAGIIEEQRRTRIARAWRRHRAEYTSEEWEAHMKDRQAQGEAERERESTAQSAKRGRRHKHRHTEKGEGSRQAQRRELGVRDAQRVESMGVDGQY